MTKTNDFSNGLVGQLFKATAADKSEQQTKTNDFSNGLAGQLLKATAADESMQQKETKDFSNGLIGQLVKATADNETESHLTQTEEKPTDVPRGYINKMAEVLSSDGMNIDAKDDMIYPGLLPMEFTDVVFDGPADQIDKLYSDITSILQKAEAILLQSSYEERTFISDGDFLMKEMFPEFIENCDPCESIVDWEIRNLSFDGKSIEISTCGFFSQPENFIDNIMTHYHGIKAYYLMSSEGTEFRTNDIEGKYFNQRYFLHAEWINCWEKPNYNNKFFSSKDEAFKFLSDKRKVTVENDEDFLANNMGATQAILREITVVGQEPKNNNLAIIHGMAWRPCA